MSLWLMRHPRVALGQPVCYGRSDVPLDEAHLAQCVQQLICTLPQGTRILTSERRRTQQVAERLVALRPDLHGWLADARLNEMDFGRWEMVPWQDIPKEAVDVWMADFSRHRFGGVECVQDMLTRTASLLQEHRAMRLPPAATLWITHAGPIHALQRLRTHAPSAAIAPIDWPQLAPAFGELLPFG